MERINQILINKKYREALQLNEQAEKDRIYCKHDLEHFLTVARVAYLLNLEEQFGISKEIIYAMGLLHDIGRFMEYNGIMEHNKASVSLAQPILKQCNFLEQEIEEISNAIIGHRMKKENHNVLQAILYQADKESRNCFLCPVQLSCYWSIEKKNKFILR